MLKGKTLQVEGFKTCVAHGAVFNSEYSGTTKRVCMIYVLIFGPGDSVRYSIQVDVTESSTCSKHFRP